jgi:uncharacterized protein GlcG (DUF336 family)
MTSPKANRVVLAWSVLAIGVFVPAASFAQTLLPNPTNDESRAPRPARARGIPSALAVEAAQAANTVCLANGNKTTTIIVDTEGVPIAMVSNDGAAAITQRIANGKALIVLKTKGSSADAAKLDPAALGPLGVARAGGLPIMAGADLVGAIAVSGSPSGQADEVCAKAALVKIQDRVK